MDIETLLPWLVGVVGVPVINFLKKQMNLEGKPAMILTAGVSLLLAWAVLVYTGGLVDATNIIEVAAKVLSVATLAYKLLSGTELGRVLGIPA